jgi:DNA-binding MarR family transcriptional regulator
MQLCPTSLRLLNGFANPPRVDEPLPDSLDSAAAPAVNRFDLEPPTPRGAASQKGATLTAVLEVAEVLITRIAQTLEPLGCSYAEYQVLSHLRDATSPVSVSALPAGGRCDRSSAAVVERLETRGLLRRVQNPDDRLTIGVQLTTRGRDLVDQASARIAGLRTQFAGVFTSSERANLARLLARIHASPVEPAATRATLRLSPTIPEVL